MRSAVAITVLVGIAVAAFILPGTPGYSSTAAYSLLTGAALGIVFQRGRFCFFCIIRDAIAYRNSGPMYAILTALAVGGVGYAVIVGLVLPDPSVGRLPPDAHIGPSSPALLLAGLAFGLGMALSGACISGHLYRLGEGYARAPIALVGSVIGFALGFLTWQTLYIELIASAPVAWLPATLGYGGALIVHLAALGLIGLLLWRRLPPLPDQPGGPVTPAHLYEMVFQRRWHPLITGALVGIIGILAYLRVEPLGVTAQLGSIARTALHDAGHLGGRLPGLDTFAGCATMVAHLIMDNGLLVIGLVLASFSVALLGNHFRLSTLTPLNSFTALLGGVLMGWGAMIALGCTVGTLLSGISAFAVSGWVFAAATFAGVWLGIRLRLVS